MLVSGVALVDIGSKGLVVGRKEAQVYMVKGGVPGDVVTVELIKKKKSHIEAKLRSVDEPSAQRTAPVCSHFEFCGGCSWQHLAYSEQLRLKAARAVQQIKRIGGVEPEELLPPLGAQQVFAYRNKMEYTATAYRWLHPAEIATGEAIDERAAIGFHVSGRFDWVMNIERCHLMHDDHNAVRNFVSEEARRLGVPFFDLKNKLGVLRNVVFKANRQGQWMVALVVNERSKEVMELCESISARFSQIHSLWLVVNTKVNDDWSDQPAELVSGSDHLIERFKTANGREVRYRIGLRSFFQTNAYQAERLYQTVSDFAAFKGDELVYDFYTGAGSIALFIAHEVRAVVGVEYVADAVADAAVNATDNEIHNCQFVAGDMAEVFTPDFVQRYGHADVVVCDPPRSGMAPAVVQRLIELAPNRVVYVSCDPATQSRDIAMMAATYRLARFQCVDMFPHTSHIESVALLLKR